MTQASSPGDLAQFIEYSLLKPGASLAQIEKLCAEAHEHRFCSVCLNGSWIAAARHFLDGSDVKVACAAGFPLGAMAGDVKRYEAEVAVDDGAHEINMVLNIARLKAGEDKLIFRELVDVVEAVDERPVKVILETCLLTDEEKVRACRFIVESGAHFVATSTGFNAAGATIADVKLLRETVGPKFGVMAAGGIREAQVALALISAGATRVGTSAGLAMIQESAEAGRQ